MNKQTWDESSTSSWASSTFGSEPLEGEAMADSGREKRRPRRRRRRRKNPDWKELTGWKELREVHHQNWPSVRDSFLRGGPRPRARHGDEFEASEVLQLSDQERALAEAREVADEKVAVYRDLVKACLIALALLIFVPPLGVIAGIYYLITRGRRFYRVMIEPGMRDRLVRDEVDKRLNQSVHAERRVLEDQHARSLEELSASIAHEIRNPITAAKSLLQQMGEEPEASENVEYARVALVELERVERSVSHLLRYARDEELRMSDVKLVEVLESALETFRERSARSKIEIVRAFDCEGAVRGDPEKLRRVAINLIGNAMDAVDDANIDDPRVEVAMGENLAGSEVWLRVSDNGVGIDPETRDKMFSPFVTSKASGTGLGLAITKKLVDAHGGQIEVISELGQGAEFVVTFPKRLPTARSSNPTGATRGGSS